MQGVLEQNLSVTPIGDYAEEAAGKKIGLVAKLFGCWHKVMSRPFTTKTSSYRTCLDCGARRKFHPESLRTSGPFYFPPSIKPDPFI